MEYKRVFTEEEISILKNDLLDINDWIDKAIDGKINNCMKRMSLKYREDAVKNGLNQIPSTDRMCALELLKDKNYKNRDERDQLDQLQAIKGIGTQDLA